MSSSIEYRVFNKIYKKARFNFNLIRLANRAESVNPWNLITSLICDCLSEISLLLLFRLACLLGLNRRKVYKAETTVFNRVCATEWINRSDAFLSYYPFLTQSVLISPFYRLSV